MRSKEDLFKESVYDLIEHAYDKSTHPTECGYGADTTSLAHLQDTLSPLLIELFGIRMKEMATDYAHWLLKRMKFVDGDKPSDESEKLFDVFLQETNKSE
jgi:hypothetical protein